MNRWSLSTGYLVCILAAGCGSDSDDSAGKSGQPAEPAAVATIESQQPAAEFDRDSELAAADRLASSGKLDQAAEVIGRVLLANPDDVEALFQLANVRAAKGDRSGAVTLLDSIPNDHPEAGLPALGQSADWCLELERYDEAERRYKQVLDRVPAAAVAHRQLAYLYNRQGRRHEAARHIQKLCELGDVRQDELHALMTVSHAIYTDPKAHKPPEGTRLYYPIGPAARARKLYTDFKYAEAAEVLRESVVAGDQPPSVVAFYGRLLVEAQDEPQFLAWLVSVDDAVKGFSEYWAALGAYLLGKRRHEEAVRALAEAIDRDPTDPSSVRRMNQVLLALGEEEESDKWQDHYVALSKTTRASNRIGSSTTPDLDEFATTITGLKELNRPLEALTWELFEALHRRAPRQTIDQIAGRRGPLIASGNAFPNRKERLHELDIDRYPLPKLDLPEATSIASITKPKVKKTILDLPRFENVAAKVGLDHTYQVASQPQPYAFAIYQSLGGGVAVLDYDLDGQPDLYLSQGGSDPPEMTGPMSNQLYRNAGGILLDVTGQSSTTEHRYSVGVTSGDWNQDGFPDLVVASIGGKTLMINNGDGTFSRRQLDVDPERKVLPSSLAIGDVTGDALPDIVAIHDVDDATMLNKPQIHPDGHIDTVSPLAFEPGIDRVIVNDAQGGFQAQDISQSDRAASTGLGVVVADFDGKMGNEIFVGNDVRPNHLWVRDQGADSWVDLAAVSGCGHGNGGLPTASMGIAAGDFDGSGTLDLHITNFYNEPASLFINRGGTFEDRCVQYKLYSDSASVLGFGSQAIDYNNDGRPDLAVTNGNVEKAPGEPLQQPPQLFVNLGDEFRLTEVVDPSKYWDGMYLGRGMARLDFNLDGRSDLVISHIGSPTAILVNQTETTNHWLAVQLVGTESERDAIGARVQVRAGDRVWTNWAVGGDGYLCRNEATIPFGIGDSTEIDQVTVTWPTGKSQSFDKIDVDQRVLLIENQNEPYLDSATFAW